MDSSLLDQDLVVSRNVAFKKEGTLFWRKHGKRANHGWFKLTHCPTANNLLDLLGHPEATEALAASFQVDGC